MNWTAEELLKAVESVVKKEGDWEAGRRRVRAHKADIVQEVQLKILEKVKNSSEPLDKKTNTSFENLSLDDAEEVLIKGKVIHRWTHNLARKYRHLDFRQSELLENVDRPIMPDQTALEMRAAERGIPVIIERSALTVSEAGMASTILNRAISDDGKQKPLTDQERKLWSRAKAKIARLTKTGVLGCLGLLPIMWLQPTSMFHQFLSENRAHFESTSNVNQQRLDHQTIDHQKVDHQKAIDAAHQVNHQSAADLAEKDVRST